MIHEFDCPNDSLHIWPMRSIKYANFMEFLNYQNIILKFITEGPIVPT